MSRVDGKVGIVTGAARGQGEAEARLVPGVVVTGHAARRHVDGGPVVAVR